MRLLRLLLLCLFSAFVIAAGGGSPRSEPVSDDLAFRAEVVELLAAERGALAPKVVVGEPSMLTIGTSSINLRNLHLHVATMPRERRRPIILGFIDSAVAASSGPTVDTSLEAVRSRLRIQIAPEEYVRRFGDAEKGLVHRPFVPGLVIAYAVDEAERFSYVLSNRLDEWKIDRAELDRIAVDNLDAAIADEPIEVSMGGEGRGGYTAILDRGGYGAARILCPRFRARLAEKLGPRLLVGIPNRDFLVAWTPDFAKGRRFAEQVEKDFGRQPHPLTPNLLIMDGDGVRPAGADDLPKR